MKRDEMVDKVTAKFVKHLERGTGNTPLSIVDFVLKQLEKEGMVYCPKKDLGRMGVLRTPEGWSQSLVFEVGLRYCFIKSSCNLKESRSASFWTNNLSYSEAHESQPDLKSALINILVNSGDDIDAYLSDF